MISNEQEQAMFKQKQKFFQLKEKYEKQEFVHQQEKDVLNK